MDFFPQENPLNNPWLIKENYNMYWRIKPKFDDWIVLFMMSFLDSINNMFKNKLEIIKLQDHCTNSFRDKYDKFHYYYKRTDKIIKGVIIYVMMMSMIYLHTFIQINIFNWVFWTLNVINFALLVRGTKSISYVK